VFALVLILSGMSRETVLARVEDDVAQGDYERAKNRLRTLIELDPTDLELRQHLAAVYRRGGNPVEAGRWSFLGDQLEREQEAFRRAYPYPWQRLRALRWSGQPEAAPEPAAQRLYALAEEIEAWDVQVYWHERGAPTEYPPEEPTWVGGVLFGAVVLALLALIGIGLATVVRWIL
jgi:hypothetical protein